MYAALIRRARRAINADEKTSGEQKTSREETKVMDTKNPSSSPFHFHHTDVKLVLWVYQIWHSALPLGWSWHTNHDRDMQARVCRRMSEEQPALRVFRRDERCNVALNVLGRRKKMRRGRIRVHKRR